MGKESIVLGVLMIVIGISLLFTGAPLVIPILFIIVGIFLLIFWRAEDKIEQRKDTKLKKTKSK